MKLTTKNGIYVLESSFSDKDTVKAAGFWWHPDPAKCDRSYRKGGCKACSAGIGKTWYTLDRVTASRLLQHADEPTRADLEGVKAAQAASRAADADIEVPCPEGLAYLPFQKAGIAYAMARPSTLIADMMGLGKTIQAIGTINADPTVKSALVVCPSTLRLNWAREAAKWLVRPMKIRVIEERELPEPGDELVILNYDKLVGPRGEALRAALMGRNWDVLIVDEAHFIKTPKAQRTVALLGRAARPRKGVEAVPGLISKARRVLLLTGTPILNRPKEIYGLLDALAPGQWGSFFTFAKKYCGSFQDKWGWHFDGATNLDELQERMRATVMIRRRKEDVLKELPPKRRQIITLPTNGAAKAVEKENAAWEHQQERLAELQAEVDLAHAAGDDEGYKKAVAALQKGYAVAFAEISRVRHDTAVAKVPAVIEHLRNTIEEIDKVVLFAHHHDVIDALAKEFGDDAVVLTGETPQADRQGLVDRFQTDPSCKMFIGSITAAGVGLTLTAASTVIFAELDWVPGNVSQAEDRCHRIGQTASVLVQHLVLDKSLDSRMAKIIVEKQEISDKALDLPFERDLPEPRRPRVYPKASDALRAAVTHGLKILSGMCDGARQRDETGFNKIDAMVGNRLARQAKPLTDGQVYLGKRILPKYHGQLPADILEALRTEGAVGGRYSEATK